MILGFDTWLLYHSLVSRLVLANHHNRRAIATTVAAAVIAADIVDAVVNISLHDETFAWHMNKNRRKKSKIKLEREAYDTLACNDYWFSVSEIHTSHAK